MSIFDHRSLPPACFVGSLSFNAVVVSCPFVPNISTGHSSNVECLLQRFMSSAAETIVLPSVEIVTETLEQTLSARGQVVTGKSLSECFCCLVAASLTDA
jgi:hypothetical protein